MTCHASTDQKLPWDNRLVTPQEFTSTEWVWHLDVGYPNLELAGSALGRSPIKAVRELGSERHVETKPSPSAWVGYVRSCP